MAFVYWIHKKDHTDIFTQGYVGITTKTVMERYKRHRENANCEDAVKSILHKAILKYGADNLIVTTVVECSYEYASSLEKKLRPHRYIGWNIAIGGADPTMLGLRHTDESKEKMRRAKLGTTLSEEHKSKLSKISLSKNPWDRASANKETWKYADVYYLGWLSCKSHDTAARRFGLTVGTLNSVFSNFEKGYNPFLDKNWKSEFVENRKASPDSLRDMLKNAGLFLPITLITQYLDTYKEYEGAA